MSQRERIAKCGHVIADQNRSGGHLLAQGRSQLGIPGRDEVSYPLSSAGIAQRCANPTSDRRLADD
jgi:hypothetical protein